MSFDDDVDQARRQLLAVDGAPREAEFDELAVLQALLPVLHEKIQSRRLSFEFSDGEDEDDAVVIAVMHNETNEPLGYIMVELEEYVFESEFSDYFDDFVDEDAAGFVDRLYACLKTGLAGYEVDQAG